MFETFDDYVRQVMPRVTGEELAQIRAAAVSKRLRRRQILLKEGDICRHKFFVVKGMLRNYCLSEDGNEYVMRFANEGGWTTEPESMVNATPSAYYIDAVEPSEVLMWTKEDFDLLRLDIPGLNALSEQVISQNMSAIQKRLLLSISSSPEERYVDFMTSFPEIFRRVPLHMIASYLGVSRETLTRVRQNLMAQAKG